MNRRGITWAAPDSDRQLLLPYRAWAPNPLAGLMLPAVLLAGCFDPGSADDPRGAAAETVVVRTEPVRTVRFQRVISGIGSCTASPAGLMPITAAVDGLVEEILVREGQVVAAGQPLVVLDDEPARRGLAEKLAARDELQASLALLLAQPRDLERQQTDLEIERARVALDSAQAMRDRLEPLRLRNEISEQHLYEAQQNFRSAELALKLAQTRRDMMMLGPQPEAVAEMQARIHGAQAAVQTAESRLEYFQLKAPGGGTVDSIQCNRGQFLAVGTEAAQVVDLSDVQVTFWLSPADVRQVHKGQRARVGRNHGRSTDDSDSLDGEVAFVGSRASPDTGRVPVRIDVPNPSKQLRLGMLVAVEVAVDDAQLSLAVPDAAIVPSENGPSIVVVRDGRTVVLHPALGLRRDGLTAVLMDGLQDGEPVVTQGAYNLPHGTAAAVAPGTTGGRQP